MSTSDSSLVAASEPLDVPDIDAWRPVGCWLRDKRRGVLLGLGKVLRKSRHEEMRGPSLPVNPSPQGSGSD